MKFFVFILGASFCLSVTARPQQKQEGDIEHFSGLLNTGAFGGTYNFAKNQQGNTHSSASDHSKYEVYEPKDYEEGHRTYGGEGGYYDTQSEGKKYYGHYGSGAEREYNKQPKDEQRGKADRGHDVYGKYGKDTYGHVDDYKKENGDIPGYGGSGNHGSLSHHNSDEKYGYHESGGKEESRGTGYYVTEKNNEPQAKEYSNIGENNKHEDHNGNKRETGLGQYASGKDEGRKLQEYDAIRQYKTLGNHGNDREYKISGEKIALGEYATGEYDDFKHGGKTNSNIGEEDKHGIEDHKEGNAEEENLKKGKGGGLGEFTSGIYDVRRSV